MEALKSTVVSKGVTLPKTNNSNLKMDGLEDVGRLVSFWDGFLAGAMLVEGSVIPYLNRQDHQVLSLKLTVKAVKIGRNPKGEDRLPTPNHHCSGRECNLQNFWEGNAQFHRTIESKRLSYGPLSEVWPWIVETGLLTHRSPLKSSSF